MAKKKLPKGTAFRTHTKQWVYSNHRLVLRRDRTYPYLTRLRLIPEDGSEVTLMTFKQDGTFQRNKDIYVRGLSTDDKGRIQEDEQR